MHTLIDWKAKRAGGRITVYGKNAETGAEIKIVGVDVITPASERPLYSRRPCEAVDMHGVKHTLLV